MIVSNILRPCYENLPVTCTRSRAALLEVGRVLNALRKQGLEQAGTIQLVKESIDLIRGFLRGEMVQYKGPRFSVPPPGSRLGFESTKDLPIYVGATGPAMLRLAGQHADGVLFNYPCTPSFVEYAMPFIDEGLKLSGRTIEDLMSRHICLSRWTRTKKSSGRSQAVRCTEATL
jgi:alkanesulfonate monooxygenase SsuD/methylene tetrahydromethanopterin reductase-like flavin-dependent oxidoreductase (luciferase family)